MSPTTKKTLLVSLAIFLTIVLSITVVYFIRKPSGINQLVPTSCPPGQHEVVNLNSNGNRIPPYCALDVNASSPSPVASTTTGGSTSGGGNNSAVCMRSFVVACASPSISPSPIPSTSAPVYPSPSPSSPSSASLDCVAKKMYENDSRNRAGFYYMEREITDTNTVQNGQIIVYNIVTRNNGGNSVPDTTITDRLSTNLTYVDGDSGCGYDSNTRTVSCTIGTLSPNSEAQRSFRASVTVAGTTSVANTAEVTSTNGQRDSCSVSIDATGRVSVVSSPAPTALPVAGVFEVTALPLTLGLLLLIIGGLGLLVL